MPWSDLSIVKLILKIKLDKINVYTRERVMQRKVKCCQEKKRNEKETHRTLTDKFINLQIKGSYDFTGTKRLITRY